MIYIGGGIVKWNVAGFFSYRRALDLGKSLLVLQIFKCRGLMFFRAGSGVFSFLGITQGLFIISKPVIEISKQKIAKRKFLLFRL